MLNKIIDVIKYEGGNDVLIYKHPKEDFNLGTQLIVHESQEAVFFRDGKALESFGPGRHTLETQNVAHFSKSVNSMTGGENVFHSEVYFINLTTELGIKWGTDSKIRMFDPISGLHLELGASGTFNIKVNDGRKLLIKVVGTTSGFEQEEIFGSIGFGTKNSIGKFRGMIISKVKTFLAKAIRENDINILEVDEHIDQLSESLRNEINKVLDDYGMFIPEFFINSILTPDDDPNFKRLKEQHAERYLKVQQQRIRKAELEAMQEADIIQAETKAKTTLIAAEGEAAARLAYVKVEAEEMRLKGYTYQEETARIVGEAAAKNEGSGAGGIASEVVRTGVGLGVGVAVAGQMVNSVKGIAVNADGTWECPNCHNKGNKGNFCESCGYKKNNSWDCACGQTGLSGNFCPNCGRKRGN